MRCLHGFAFVAITSGSPPPLTHFPTCTDALCGVVPGMLLTVPVMDSRYFLQTLTERAEGASAALPRSHHMCVSESLRWMSGGFLSLSFFFSLFIVPHGCWCLQDVEATIQWNWVSFLEHAYLLQVFNTCHVVFAFTIFTVLKKKKKTTLKEKKSLPVHFFWFFWHLTVNGFWKVTVSPEHGAPPSSEISGFIRFDSRKMEGEKKPKLHISEPPTDAGWQE